MSTSETPDMGDMSTKHPYMAVSGPSAHLTVYLGNVA
jgi:hypothetical protein